MIRVLIGFLCVAIRVFMAIWALVLGPKVWGVSLWGRGFRM